MQYIVPGQDLDVQAAQRRVSSLVQKDRDRPLPGELLSIEDTLTDIGLESIEMISLLLAVEREFDLEIPQHEITSEAFRSISTIAALMVRLSVDNLGCGSKFAAVDLWAKPAGVLSLD